MRKMKRFLSLMLAVVMVLAMSVPVSADEPDYIITITNSVTDKTYTAYKVFDATYTGDGDDKIVSYTITIDSKWYSLVNGDTTVSSTDVNGTTATYESPFTLAETTVTGTYNVSLKNGKNDADVANWFNAITADQLTTAGITSTTSGIGNGGSLELNVGSAGYYYITTTSGSTVTVTTAAPTATVADKNQQPGTDLEKTVSDTETQIGDSIIYTITSSVPPYDGDTEITEYKFEDTLGVGLTPPTNAGAISVKILDKDGYVYAYLKDGTDGVSISISGQTITITYDPRKITKATSAVDNDTLSTATSYPAEATIKIIYTATVNASALYANGNTVTETWKPQSTGTTSTVDVYTYGFNLVKVSESDTQLAGAEFQLTVENSTTPIGFLKTVDGTGKVTYTVATADQSGEANYYTTITSIASGTIEIFGLDADTTYTLTETKAPDGYNLAAATTITVGQDGSYNTSTGINTKDTKVVDNAGSALPSAGGMGTTILYIIGGILVIGAAILLITRRRMSQTK